MPVGTRAQSAAIGGIAALFLLAHLGEVPLAAHDDAVYASEARAIVESGDWLTLHFAGRPTFGNPPLYPWLVAVGFELFGISEWSAILPSALAGALCILLLHRIGLRMGGPGVALGAALMLLTTPYFLKYARRAMLDVPLLCFFLLAMLAYLRARAGVPRAYLLLGLAVGAGVLTKSAPGVFPLLVVGLHLLWTGRGRELFSPWFLAGLGVAGVVAGPWYLQQWAVHGDRFLVEHFGGYLWDQAFGGRAASSRGYLWRFGADYWPWLPLALAGLVIELRKAFRERDPEARLLVLWIGVVLGVMSLSRVKDLRYVMAVFPALSLAGVRALARWLRPELVAQVLPRMGLACLAAAVLLWLLPVSLDRNRHPGVHQLALAAAERVPEGRSVATLDLPYWSFQPVFAFYAQRRLQPVKDAEGFREHVAREGFGLLPRRSYRRYFAGELTELAQGEDWLLVGEARPPGSSAGAASP